MKESEILKSIRTTLPLYCQSVVWCDRMQAGTRQIDGRWIHMGKAGTPDLYAIIREDGGHVLFIECKRKGGKQSDEQKIFEHKVLGLKHIHYILAFSLGDVLKYISKNILTTP